MKFISTLLLITISSISTQAVSENYLTSAIDSLNKTWQADDYELYVPINTWHNRSFYSQEKIDSFNERPWGIGIGKYRFDEDGDWNSLYIMEFQDSHNDIEPIAGFAFQKCGTQATILALVSGYTAGFTMRHDMNYVPIPLVLPLISAEYKQLSLQTTYVPGGNGNGNVLFTWLRWQIK